MTADPCELQLVDLDENRGAAGRDGQPGPRWRPDMQMVPAALAVPHTARSLTDLELPDRCWMVAGLTRAGLTAIQIANKTRCSERLVKAIRAEPMTSLCDLMQKETGRLTDELRVERIDHAATRNDYRQANRSIDRLRTQVDQLLDAFGTGQTEVFRCGHPKVRYNVYQHGGKLYCRECRTHRRRQLRITAAICVVVNS